MIKRYFLVFLLIGCTFTKLCFESQCLDEKTKPSFKKYDIGQKELDDFNSWLQGQQNENHTVKVEAAFFGNLGIGLRAKERISKMENIFHTLKDKILHDNSFIPLQEEIGISKEVVKSITDPTHTLLLSILHHLYYLEKSQFEAWLKILPSHEIPLYITIDDNYLEKSLLGTEIAEMIREERNSILKGFEELNYQLLSMVSNEERSILLNGRDVIPFADYVAVSTLINRRAWRIQGKLFMVPGCDFFNHKENLEPSDFNINGRTFLKFHKLNGNLITVLADRDFESGEQVFESYTIDNHFLYLIHHNFLPEDEHDCIDLPLFTKEDIINVEVRKRSLFQLLGIDKYVVCLTPNQMNLKRIEAFGDVFHMNQDEMNKCIGQMSLVTDYGLGNKLNQVIDKCQSKQWNIKDFTISLLDGLERTLEDHRKRVKILENEIDNHITKLLLMYYKKRVRTMESLRAELKNLKEKKKAYHSEL